MSDQFEPSASSASDSASDDDITRQRDHVTADTALGAGSTSSLPLDVRASAALTEPHLARLTRRLGSAERTSRRSRWIGGVGALMATALVVALIGYLLVNLAPARSNPGNSPTGTPPLAALATATTATSATVASDAAATSAGAAPDVHPTPGFTVQSFTGASVDMSTDSGSQGLIIEPSAPIPTAIGGCGPHVLVTVVFNIILSNNPTPPGRLAGNTAPISYYSRNSDGSSDGSAAHPVVEQIPSAGTNMTMRTAWQMPYTEASGSSQWTELDIVQPNQMSYRASYKAVCAFALTTPHVSVSPTSYNCATGGDQTFTVTGTLKASFTPDNASHTVTYYWDNEFSTHGTTTPTQTVTFPPGVTSIPAQPETVIGNAASQTAAFKATLRENYGTSQYYSGVTVTSAC